MTASFRVAVAEVHRRDQGERVPLRTPSISPSPPTVLLSVREQEIAELVAQGLSNKEIGLALGISHWTVSTHLRRVFAKLDISRRVDLCRLVTSCWNSFPD